jgi:hypothetical protein
MPRRSSDSDKSAVVAEWAGFLCIAPSGSKDPDGSDDGGVVVSMFDSGLTVDVGINSGVLGLVLLLPSWVEVVAVGGGGIVEFSYNVKSKIANESSDARGSASG